MRSPNKMKRIKNLKNRKKRYKKLPADAVVLIHDYLLPENTMIKIGGSIACIGRNTLKRLDCYLDRRNIYDDIRNVPQAILTKLDIPFRNFMIPVYRRSEQFLRKFEK